MTDIIGRLDELGVTLTTPAAPAANYLPFVISDKTIYVSGQVSVTSEGLIKGRVGDTMSVEDGAAAARVCAINLITQVNVALGGDWSKFKRVVKLTGFVNSAPDFEGQPQVINGASNFLVDVFGERGRHARSAVGAVLPLGVAVEIEGIFEIA